MARKNDFNRKASRPRSWQTSVSKKKPPILSQSKFWLLLCRGGGGAHCVTSGLAGPLTVAHWQLLALGRGPLRRWPMAEWGCYSSCLPHPYYNSPLSMSIPQSCGKRDDDLSGYFPLNRGNDGVIVKWNWSVLSRECCLKFLVSNAMLFIYNYLNLMKFLLQWNFNFNTYYFWRATLTLLSVHKPIAL